MIMQAHTSSGTLAGLSLGGLALTLRGQAREWEAKGSGA